MARFYGMVHANRGMATRCGHRSITTIAKTWSYAIRTSIWENGKNEDLFEVALQEENGGSRSLFKGTQEDVKRFIVDGVLPRGKGRYGDD